MMTSTFHKFEVFSISPVLDLVANRTKYKPLSSIEGFFAFLTVDIFCLNLYNMCSTWAIIQVFLELLYGVLRALCLAHYLSVA